MVPEASRRIPVALPFLGEEEAAAARRVILSGWVTQGPEVAAFEEDFKAFTGSPHACAVSSCTAALHLALLALGVGSSGDGPDEVITVSHSYIATANAVRYTGAIPVFADVLPATGNIDPAEIERLVTPRTRAVLVVHQIGMPCDMPAVLAIARRLGLKVVEDCACAIGSEIRVDGRWERIGKPHGDIACFSFHPRKVVTTGDGGMLTTADTSLDATFRLLRQHGMSVPDTTRHGSAKVIFEEHGVLGYNYRMTDIQAAVGREQLKRLPGILARRRALVDRYRALLKDVPGVTPDVEPEWARSNWQSFAVTLAAGIDQRSVLQFLLDRGISGRRGVMCAHRERPYAGSPGVRGRLPGSEYRQDRTIILPLYVQMEDADVDRVVSALADAVHEQGRL